MLDERFLKTVPRWRNLIYRMLPTNIAQVMEAFIIKKKYDGIISWAENLGIPLAILLKLTGSHIPHFGIFSWISKPKKAILLKRVHSEFERIFLMSSRQRDHAIHQLKIPENKVQLLRWPVDQNFWRPMNFESDMICAVGREMRDYGTLIRAIEGLDIRCHIAAGGITTNKKDAWMKDVQNLEKIPSNITIGKKTFSELRELYARSRFVVIPLFPTETDNGTTSILEAMAMGKAVICSKVDGQADVIEDGVNGMFVPPLDSKALREAIMYLWNNLEIADKMGREGRKFIEQNHSFDSFVKNVQATVTEVLEEKKQILLEQQRIRNSHRKKILTIVTTGLRRPSRFKLRQMEEADLYPRALLYEDTVDSDMLDEKYIASLPGIQRMFYSLLPAIAAQVIEAFFVRKKYQAVVTWSGRLSIPYAFLLKMFGSRHPHIAMVTWISRPKKSTLLKFVHTHIDKIILWSSVQKQFANEFLKIPETKTVLVGRRVDQKFWQPMNIPTDMICSSGQEMRDYPTLIKALDGIDIKCHIATGALRGELFDTVKAIGAMGDLPKNISIGMLSYAELRKLYSRSRFVIIPLHQTDTDNGVTVIEESMAMGKAVICTRTRGQVDIIQENVTGIFVPPYDPKALREAILYLWNNPDIAQKMGEEGRKYIEKYHTIDKFVASVKEVIDGVIIDRRRLS
ncbi:MAG: glycosyltransferase family 4 protein [Bacteroidota bacterium]|nr:glycosyltransferase family 4 protein [Bacteroidota bacterium]